MDMLNIENAVSPHMKSPTETEPTSIVEGHHFCQTHKSLWLNVGDIYEKLHRPNIYDIGGTYIESVPDFWFTCKTEKSHGMSLLHLFAGNRTEGSHTIGVSADLLVYNDKDKIVRLAGDIETYKLDCKQHKQSYVTTYSFKHSEVEDILKGKKLHIAVILTNKEEKTDSKFNDIIESVRMTHDNRSLLEDPVCSDFIIESQEGEEFPVHRHLLSLHSDVFKAMLHEDMVESKTGRVKLVDVASEDLKIMLEYIYTSSIAVIEDINFPNIIMLADRYNLLGLRKLCDHILIDQLGPDTALDILVLSDRFDCGNVKNRALQYIKRNKEHFKNQQFDQVDSIALVKDLCSVFLL